MTAPQTCLRIFSSVLIGFAASEPATNKALQEVRVLGGFGLLVVACALSRFKSLLCISGNFSVADLSVFSVC
jgi:hypothetical protein